MCGPPDKDFSNITHMVLNQILKTWVGGGGGGTLETRRRKSRLTPMYKLPHGLIDIDTLKYLIQHSENRTRGSHQFKFHVPHTNKDVCKFSFFSKNYSGLELPP